MLPYKIELNSLDASVYCLSFIELVCSNARSPFITFDLSESMLDYRSPLFIYCWSTFDGEMIKDYYVVTAPLLMSYALESSRPATQSVLVYDALSPQICLRFTFLGL